MSYAPSTADASQDKSPPSCGKVNTHIHPTSECCVLRPTETENKVRLSPWSSNLMRFIEADAQRKLYIVIFGGRVQTHGV
eukprot:2205502-Amphidinium_carterae.1